MKKFWLLLIGCILVGLIVLNLEIGTGKQESYRNKLMLRNIEALAGDESGNETPCTVAGGFCYGKEGIFWGISLI